MIVFYDGDCGLCHASVKFLMERDKHDVFRFAPLQGATARETLGPDAATSSTVVLWANGKVFRRSKAVFQSLKKLEVAPWTQFGKVLSLCPGAIADIVYNTIARLRTVLWPTPKGLCPMLPPDKAHKFLP